MGLFVRRQASGLKSNKLPFEQVCILTGQYITPSTCWECFLEAISLVGYLIALAGETIILILNGCTNAKRWRKEICPICINFNWVEGESFHFLQAILAGGCIYVMVTDCIGVCHFTLLIDPG